MSERMLTIPALIAVLCLQACGGPDPAKVQADVEKAQADAQKIVAEAQAKFDKASADARKDIVEAQADARADAADANANPPAAVNATPYRASDGKVAKTRADAQQKTADAQFDLDKARAQANYKVGVAHCESQSGLSRKACKETAKAVYETNLATAKQRRHAAPQRG